MLLTTFFRYALRPQLKSWSRMPEVARAVALKSLLGHRFPIGSWRRRFHPEVVALLCYHAVKLRYLVGGVLQVGVHCDDDFAPGRLESAVECGALAVVAPEADAAYRGIGRREAAYHVPRAVAAAVVDEDGFVPETVCGHYPVYPCGELRKRFAFVQQGDDHRYVGCLTHGRFRCRRGHRSRRAGRAGAVPWRS